MNNLNGKKILLIICGGIAAYKSLDLIRKFREEGCDITCILTKSGSEFVTPLSIESLSGNRVYTDLFNLTDEHQMGHIQLRIRHSRNGQYGLWLRQLMAK